jgi:branched-chain amino acid transport system substrate-binding protein
MRHNYLLLGFLTLVATALTPVRAMTQEILKIGLILPMTGYSQSTGQEVDAGARLFIKQHGNTVANKKVQVILRDDVGVADNTRRIAQELIANEKVAIVAGFGVTPSALAVAPLASEAKVIELVMAAATSSIVEKSPYIVRTSGTMAQSAAIIADWAAKNGINKVVTLVSDYAPGVEAEKTFIDRYQAAGGIVVASLRVSIQGPDFAPILQRVADIKPDAIFIFFLSSQGANFMRQFVERGLDKSGVKITGTGDVTGDDDLPSMGDAIVGAITAHFYSASHQSALNNDYVAEFPKIAAGMRPSFMSVGGYDGMQLIYRALERTGGKSDADSLITAMKGMEWESPRGTVSIDPETRDIVQNIYIRKVEKVNGQLYNQEFQTFEAVKDPIKAARVKR